MIKFTFDPEANASYLYLTSDRIARTVTVRDDASVMINLDLDANDEVVGVEVLSFTTTGD